MDSDSSVALAFLDALVRRDFAGVEATLHPHVRFRALVPDETVSTSTSSEAVSCFRRWFADKTDVEIVERHIAVLVDRVVMRFRAHLKKQGQSYLVEQSLCGDVDDGRFSTLDMLCAGFRPTASAASSDTTHVFDAGDLGCGSGLPREFRTRLAQIPVGHVLEVITDDPSAREDLPSMARLLGHRVRSVEPGPGRRLSIRVERIK